MDALLGLQDGKNALLAISKNTNAHLIGLYWSGAEIQARWILRSKTAPHPVHAIEDFTALHAAMMDIQVTEDAESGRLKVKFGGLPVMDTRELFLVALPQVGPTDPAYGICFSQPDGLPAQLREVYVDIAPAGTQGPTKCYCRCRSLSTGEEFVEVIDVDLGIIAQFM